MQKFFKPFRLTLVFVIVAAFLTVYVTALYKLQIYDARPAEGELYPQDTSKRTVTLAASRGNIYDRNGILLASSRPSYNITLSWSAITAAPNTNQIILSLIYAAAENGIAYSDTFPITRGAPFAFLSDMSDAQRSRLNKYMAYFDKYLSPDMSASDLFNWLKDHYKIDFTTGISDARLIIGVRYELETRVIKDITNTPYIFAEDIGPELAAYIDEQSFPGVYIETNSVREYHTPYAAHVLGYTRRIDDNDSDKYKELGYPLDAIVGKTGAELAFEHFLHGKDGTQIVTTTDTGAVWDVLDVAAPEPGKNVYLTLDIGLQAVAEDALNSHINTINLSRDEFNKVEGGAVVVTEVKTGAALAIASAPSFDLSTLWQNYSAIENDPMNPLYNRATQGLYNPGSTFKMVTALAGLRQGVIGPWTLINDTGIFTESHESYHPKCWIYNISGGGHGQLNVVGALRESCNFFFYKVGFETGFRPIADTAFDFGFGQSTGIEIPEKIGNTATREYKRQVLNEGWWDGDTLQSAIGQSYNYFTPLQLANYVATIANGGTRYMLTLLGKVKSADYSELVFSASPTVAFQFQESDFFPFLSDGMKAVAQSGTAASEFLGYNTVSVAAKTGTVQSDASRTDDGVFVCYAPADNPVIAIAVVVEKGTSGSAIIEIAKAVLDYFFASEPTFVVMPNAVPIP